MVLCRRFHFFEVNDQPWWPNPLRSAVQSSLTLLWTLSLPLLQPQSPASLVARTLVSVLGRSKIPDYVYVDFASGAGGPTPYIEEEVNREIRRRRGETKASADDGEPGEEEKKKAVFVLTDISPHLEAWEAAAKKSDNLTYVAEPVDAADAPGDLVERVLGRGEQEGGKGGKKKKKKVMRLFSLAFHHFDDELAEGILRNTIESGDGFAIFELQSRTPNGFLTVFLLGPLLTFLTPLYYYDSPFHLFFTYVIPLIPFCVVFDGYISILRTRTPGEVAELVRKANGGRTLEGWRFMSGQERHTWPMGWMNWIICVRDEQ